MMSQESYVNINGLRKQGWTMQEIADETEWLENDIGTSHDFCFEERCCLLTRREALSTQSLLSVIASRRSSVLVLG